MVTFVLVVGLYYLAPVDDSDGTEVIIRLLSSLLLFIAVLIWQFRNTVNAAVPQLRAVEALGSSIPLFLVIFAMVYLSISRLSPASFTEPLNHTRALYFSITTFATVGFGDITPRTDATRLVVAVQMLLDLLLLGSIVKVLSLATKRGLETTGEPNE